MTLRTTAGALSRRSCCETLSARSRWMRFGPTTLRRASWRTRSRAERTVAEVMLVKSSSMTAALRILIEKAERLALQNERQSGTRERAQLLHLSFGSDANRASLPLVKYRRESGRCRAKAAPEVEEDRKSLRLQIRRQNPQSAPGHGRDPDIGDALTQPQLEPFSTAPSK
jgi:hypothetical protein